MESTGHTEPIHVTSRIIEFYQIDPYLKCICLCANKVYCNADMIRHRKYLIGYVQETTVCLVNLFSTLNAIVVNITHKEPMIKENPNSLFCVRTGQPKSQSSSPGRGCQRHPHRFCGPPTGGSFPGGKAVVSRFRLSKAESEPTFRRNV
jgi:hypothetical protein